MTPVGGDPIRAATGRRGYVPGVGEDVGDGVGEGDVGVGLGAVCTLTWNPAAFSLAVASLTESCFTLGTDTIFGPVDTTRTTWLPAGTTFPLGGLVLITMFFGTVALGCFCTVYFSPAAV